MAIFYKLNHLSENINSKIFVRNTMIQSPYKKWGCVIKGLLYQWREDGGESWEELSFGEIPPRRIFVIEKLLSQVTFLQLSKRELVDLTRIFSSMWLRAFTTYRCSHSVASFLTWFIFPLPLD